MEKAIKNMQKYNIQPEAWGPLSEGQKNIFCNRALDKIASKYAYDEKAISAVVIGIYIVVNILGGIIAGKLFKKNKFLWGLAAGVIYFSVLLLFGIVIFKTGTPGINVVGNALICAVSRMTGGMFGAGTHKQTC